MCAAARWRCLFSYGAQLLFWDRFRSAVKFHAVIHDDVDIFVDGFLKERFVFIFKGFSVPALETKLLSENQERPLKDVRFSLQRVGSTEVSVGL